MLRKPSNAATPGTPVVVRRGQPPLPARDGLTPSRVRIADATSGATALEALTHLVNTQRHRHPDDDAAAVTRRFERGEVVLGPPYRVAAPDEILKPGEDLWFYRMPAPEPRVPYECVVLHEDEHLLVVDKPPFLATMPRGQHITETATVRMRRATGNNDLAPAHRLDLLTSGVLVFTKHRRARGPYQTLFASRSMKKMYHAVAPLADVTPGTTWSTRIVKTPGTLQAVTTSGEPNAHTLVQHVRPLEAEETVLVGQFGAVEAPMAKYTLVPLTGKTHQLRLHMCEAGAPIHGDPTYPQVQPKTVQFRTPLHLVAAQLEFEDPLTGEYRVLKAQRSVLDPTTIR